MLHRNLFFYLVGFALSLPVCGYAQIEPDSEGHYFDPKQGEEANPTGNVDYRLMRDDVKAAPSTRKRGTPIAPASSYGLPTHVNNGATKYFRRPVINQKGNSCGISSRFANMFAYELNAYRDRDGSLAENMLPPHFAFVPAYATIAKENYAKYVGCPDGVTFGGTVASSIYGGPYNEKSSNYGRMQGYEKWHKAMCNRITNNPSFPVSCMTEAGALAWKRWLYNHNGDTSFQSGGIIGIGCASSGWELADIAATTANDAAGVTGLKYMAHFGTSTDHAVTIVGYDDRIEFDLDGNGTYGETSNRNGQNETGAWILANSWGSSFGNDGMVYVPYALADATSTTATYNYKAAGSGWTGEVYQIRKDYTPLRTLKAAVAYSKRSEIQISVGIAQDITATAPEKTHVLLNHNYHGDYDGNGVDADVPMLGRWADGKLHTEAMEFGYDLTDFTDDNFDKHRPLKYFLIIKSKSGATGTGQIEYASILDYELNANGVETPFASKNVNISNAGGTTTISVVVYGEELPAPTQLAASSKTLSWTAPAGAAYSVTKYNVYNNDEYVGSTTSTSYTLSATPANGSSYTVRAVYTIGGKECESTGSNAVVTQTAYDTNAQSFSGGAAFYVPDVCPEAYNGYTIEFDYYPTSTSGQQCCVTGPSIFAFIYSNRLYAGSSTSDYGSSLASNVLTANSWNHIAYVISGTSFSVYVNGTRIASRTNAVSGMGAGSSISFGGINGQLAGRIDEVKIWNTARTATQIVNYRNTPIGTPRTTANLLAYFKGDIFEGDDGVTYLRDCAHDHHAPISGTSTSTTGITLSNSGAPTSVSATISAPTSIYAGLPVSISASSHSDNAATWAWTCTDATISGSNANPTTFTFNSAGTKTISLTVTDVTGKRTATVTKSVTVQAAPTPTANFSLSSESTKGSDRISFISQNTAPGCTYSWAMPGAEETTATTRNASASYTTLGQKTVTLTVTGPTGTTYTHSETFNVNASAPLTRYTVSPNIIVKGETVTLTDNSLYSPTNWSWRFDSDNNRITYTGQNGTITPTKAGVYDLVLVTSNAEGSDYAEASRALVVCNSNSYNGLNIAGGNQAITATLSSAPTTAWTIDYWFNPASLGSSTHGITGTNGSSFSLTANAAGALSLNVGSQSVSSSDNFYIPNEWHHYAVTFSSGTVKFYRDGTLINERTVSTTNFSSYFKTLQLGGSAAPMTGMLDEFRVWNTTLSQADIRNNCVAPISSSSSGLQLYWQMNQSNTLTVTDATGNGVTGTLSGFTNAGDAWSDSKGVFALDFGDLSVPSASTGRTQLTTAYDEIYGVSDEQDGNAYRHSLGSAFDGNTATYYESMWEEYSTLNDMPYPHSFILRRHALHEITAFDLYANASPGQAVAYQRETSASYGRAANVSIEESDDALNWEIIDKKVRLYDVATNNVVLPRPVTKEYVRFSFDDPLYYDGHDVSLIINEMNFYGTANEPAKTEVPLAYVACSDEETVKENLPGANAVDGDPATIWHSQWYGSTGTATAYPHTVTVQNTSLADIDMLGFFYTRTTGYRAGNLKVETSSDGSTWTTAYENLRMPYGATAYVKLPTPVSDNYIRLTFLRNQATAGANGGNYLAINEIRAYGVEETSDKSVTWRVMNGETMLTTVTKNYPAGTTVTAYPDELTVWETNNAERFVGLPELTSFKVTGNMVKDVAYVWTGPFQISDSNTEYYYSLGFFDYWTWYYGDNNCLINYLSSADSGALPMTKNADASDTKYQWAFFGNPFTGFTVKNRATGKTLYDNGALASEGIPVLSETNATTWTLLRSTYPANHTNQSGSNEGLADAFANAFTLSTSGWFCMNYGFTNSLKFASNTQNDRLAAIKPTLVATVNTHNTITWRVMDGTTTIYEVEKDYKNGSTVSSYPDEMTTWVADYTARYVSLPTLTPFTVTNDGTKEVQYNWDGPFQISKEGDMHWYFVKVRNKYLSAYEGSTDPCPLTQYVNPNANAAKWAFVGSPFVGFKLMLYGHDNLCLSSTGTGSDGGVPTLKSDDALWIVTKTNETQFSMKCPEANFYWNDYGNSTPGVLKNWTSATDGGAQVTIEEVDDTKIIVSQYYRIRSAETGEDYFKYNLYENLRLTVDESSNLLRINRGATDYTDMKETIFKVEALTDGTFLISKNGYYVAPTSAGAQVSVVTDEADAYHCQIENYVNLNSDQCFRIIVGNDASKKYLNIDSWSNQTTAYNLESNNRQTWFIEPVDDDADIVLVTSETRSPIDGILYSTAYLPFAYTVDAENGSAYTISLAGSIAEANQLSGFVPENTPVLLLSDGDEVRVTPTVARTLTSTDEANIASNDLQGIYTSRAAATNEFVFGDVDGTPGFYHLRDGINLKPYRSFLVYNGPKDIRGFAVNIDGTTTTLDTVFGDNPNADNACYDLQGRRVSKPQQNNVYIRNGKKVLVH